MAVEPAGANGTVRAAAAADEPATKRPKTEVEPPKAAAPISEAALQNTPWPVFVEGSSDFGSAGDGWWAHKGGEWLFNREENSYFHLPTGQLHSAAAAQSGASAAPAITASELEGILPLLSRQELLGFVFQGLDIDGDGRLNCAELKAFAVHTGFRGNDQVWAAEFVELCAEVGGDAAKGVDQAAFTKLVEDDDDNETGCSRTDKELVKMLRSLPKGMAAVVAARSSPAEAAGARQRGEVRWFNAVKGFGFIAPADGGADVFVHRNQLKQEQQDKDVEGDLFLSLRPGQRVSYTLGETDNGRTCAVQVSMETDGSAASRAATGAGEDGEMADGDEDDDAESSGSSVEVDVEQDLTTGAFAEKGPNKDAIEDYSVEKIKLPLDVFGDSAMCFYWAVFDGHGGSSCAEYAASHLHTNLFARLRDRAQGANLEATLKTALLGGFKITEHNWLQFAKKNNDCAGSTACAMCVFGPDEDMRLRLFMANCGDSRAVLGKVDGSAVRLTQDHKPELPAEKKRVELNGGSVGKVSGIWRCILPPKRRLLSGIVGLAVSRSFGDKEFKGPDIVSAEPEITIHEVDWDADEFVILATDGIWDVITDKDAVKIVRKVFKEEDALEAAQTEKPPPGTKSANEKACEALVKRAGEKGSVDDKTAVIVRFGWMKAKAMAAAEAARAGSAEAEAAGGYWAPEPEELLAGMEDGEEEDAENEPCEDEIEPEEPTGLTIMPKGAPKPQAMDDSDDDELDAAAAAALASGSMSVAPAASASTGEKTSKKKGDDDNIFASAKDDKAEEAEELPAFLRQDATAGASGVGTKAADPAGLFADLVPTQEELAETVGPLKAPALDKAAAAEKAAAAAERAEAEAAAKQSKSAVDDGLDMFG
eukprot:TRINITY_DN14522_c0_g1_i2.p1 TRINITY_DN14522_c0_g1~~TRINITY_DN14522_c0_g1_i2.p1  ORF type:complete len:878 (+),score=286.47 TRINITY_DN14522_c0_g1_i2:164-2797(+)